MTRIFFSAIWETMITQSHPYNGLKKKVWEQIRVEMTNQFLQLFHSLPPSIFKEVSVCNCFNDSEL